MWGCNVMSSWSCANYGTVWIICFTMQPDTDITSYHSLIQARMEQPCVADTLFAIELVPEPLVFLTFPHASQWEPACWNSASPLFLPPSLFQATQFLPSALSSDPLHDRIGGVNWNSHTVRVSHFHLFIYLYKSDLPGPLIYSACMQICIVFALNQGRHGNIYFKVGIHLFDIEVRLHFFFTLKLLPLGSGRLLKTSSCPRSISF